MFQVRIRIRLDPQEIHGVLQVQTSCLCTQRWFGSSPPHNVKLCCWNMPANLSERFNQELDSFFWEQAADDHQMRAVAAVRVDGRSLRNFIQALLMRGRYVGRSRCGRS